MGYHFTAQGEASWYDFAIQISKNYKNYNPSKIVKAKHFTTIAARPVYSVLNNSKSLSIFPEKFTWQKSTDEVVKNLNLIRQ